MSTELEHFRALAARAVQFNERHRPTIEEPDEQVRSSTIHPFNERNIHPGLPSKVQRLFDDGHYAEATFEAMKYLEKCVRQASGLKEAGQSLMMKAFGLPSPRIALNGLATRSETDEQEGFKFLFAGAIMGIRNPRGHDSVSDSPQDCLDHLALASFLLRKLRAAGYEPEVPNG